MELRKACLSVFATIFLLSIVGCQSSERESVEKVELIISAAASLQNALGEIERVYEKENEEISLVVNYGGSGALQHQIKNGAPADLFISAAVEPFEFLLQNGWIDKEMETNLLSNKLVLVTGDYSKIEGIENIERASKIAIGSPDSVPAGQYAKQSLEQLGLWESIKDKLVFTKDVTQVLTYVETGNVDAGFVYATDAKSSDQVMIKDMVPDESHEDIVYPAGVLSSSKEKEKAEELFTYLQSDEAQKIFEKYGFKGLK